MELYIHRKNDSIEEMIDYFSYSEEEKGIFSTPDKDTILFEKAKTVSTASTIVILSQKNKEPMHSPSKPNKVKKLDLTTMKTRPVSKSISPSSKPTHLYPTRNVKSLSSQISSSDPVILLEKKVHIDPRNEKNMEVKPEQYAQTERGVHLKRRNLKKTHTTSTIDSTSKSLGQPIINKDSLFTPRMEKLREYYPSFEFANINYRLNEVKFQNLQQVQSEKKQAKFNLRLKKYLEIKMRENLQKLKDTCAYSRYEVSPVALQLYLEAFCRDELNLLSENEKKSAISIVISNSPRVRELVKIIKESGMLQKPIILRLIFMLNCIITFHSDKKAYTEWSKRLQETWFDLIKPDVLTSGQQGRMLSDFLLIIDQIYAGHKGRKTLAMLDLAIGEKKEGRKILIDYLHSWAELPENNLAKFKEQVKIWSSDNLTLLNINAWQHNWYQNPDQDKSLDSITLYEVMRCFGNEDNGVCIIPKRIEIGTTLVHEEGKHSYPSLFNFYCKLADTCYTQGLIPQHFRKSDILEDVEILSMSSLMQEEFRTKLFERIYPLCLFNLMKSLKEDEKIDFKKLPHFVVKPMLFPKNVSLFLSAMDLSQEEIKGFYENRIYPAALKDINLMNGDGKKKQVEISQEILERLETAVLNDFTPNLAPFLIAPYQVSKLVFGHILPDLSRELDLLIEDPSTSEPTQSHDTPFYHLPHLFELKMKELEALSLTPESLQPIVSENLTLLTVLLTDNAKEDANKYIQEMILPNVAKKLNDTLGKYRIEDIAYWLVNELPDSILEGVEEWLEQSPVKCDIKKTLGSFREKITQTIEKWLDAPAKQLPNLDRFFSSRLVSYLSKEIADVLKKKKITVIDFSLSNLESLLGFVPRNVFALLDQMGFSSSKVELFLKESIFPKVIEDVQSQLTEKSPKKLLMKYSPIYRLPKLVRYLRLYTNSCWYHADQCIFKIHPKLREKPFSAKYGQGMSFTSAIHGINDFYVTFNRSLLIDKSDKVLTSLATHIVEIPFSWKIEPHEESWKACLGIHGELKFIINLNKLDKWRFINTLLNWENLEEAEEDKTAPRILSSPRHSKLLSENI